MKKLFFPLLLLLLLLTSCTEKATSEQDIFAMDTYMNIKIWGDESALKEVIHYINALDSSLSITDKDSEIYALNTNGSTQLSQDTITLLEESVFYSKLTGGAFDCTVYPLVKAWGFSEPTQCVPSDSTITALLPYVGSEHVEISGDDVTLHAGTMLDFGAIAKGYAADQSIRLLKDSGIETAIVCLGGNVQTLGSKPDGSDWLIGIADPKDPSEPLAELHFKGSMALVTSGSYQRYFEKDGQRYHHILDPKTGKPVDNGLASVTVLSESGTMADAYSTALFVMGLEEASQFWRQERNFEAVFILEDGSIYATKDAAPLLRSCEFTEINP